MKLFLKYLIEKEKEIIEEIVSLERYKDKGKSTHN